MSGHLQSERLEELALGQTAAAGEEAHLADCAQCARELAWALAERTLLQRRPAAATDHLWAGVQDRISRPARRAHRPHWARRIVVGAAAAGAVAASLLFALRPMRPAVRPTQPVAQAPATAPAAQPASETRRENGPDARTLAALDRAEADYRDAAKILEEEYARIRPSMDAKLAARWDETLSRARTNLGDAQKNLVAMDVNARMRVLDGYAAYVRSLRTALVSQEANP